MQRGHGGLGAVAYVQPAQNDVQPFIFNIGYTYVVPKFGQSKLLKGVAAGWTFGGLLEYASGAPIPAPTATTKYQPDVALQPTP